MITSEVVQLALVVPATGMVMVLLIGGVDAVWTAWSERRRP